MPYTAYDMRISDWSSDVCSSDLPAAPKRTRLPALPAPWQASIRTRPPSCGGLEPMLQSIGTRPHGRGRNEIPERERNDRRTPPACPISRWHPGADRCRRVLLDPGRARGLDPHVPRPPCLPHPGPHAPPPPPPPAPPPI